MRSLWWTLTLSSSLSEASGLRHTEKSQCEEKIAMHRPRTEAPGEINLPSLGLSASRAECSIFEFTWFCQLRMTERGEKNFKYVVLSFPHCLLWKAVDMTFPRYGWRDEYSQRYLGESRADREESRRLNMTSRLSRESRYMASMTGPCRNQKLRKGEPKGWRSLG